MFELIGLLLATAFFFALATVASAILGSLTWLLVRKRPLAPRKRLLAAAVVIPLASAAYIWLCVAILPGESLFGDINEPLPNGYVVKALGKMPDFADISDPTNSWRAAPLSEYVGKIAINGPLVIGQYSHPFGEFKPNPNEPYFIFDTSTGKTTDLPTLSALQKTLGHPVDLAEVQFFRSPLATRRRRIDNTIELGPPLLALLLLVALIWYSRKRIDSPNANIYT